MGKHSIPPPEPKRKVRTISMSDIDIEIKNSPAMSYMMHEINILRKKVNKLERWRDHSCFEDRIEYLDKAVEELKEIHKPS